MPNEVSAPICGRSPGIFGSSNGNHPSKFLSNVQCAIASRAGCNPNLVRSVQKKKDGAAALPYWLATQAAPPSQTRPNFLLFKKFRGRTRPSRIFQTNLVLLANAGN